MVWRSWEEETAKSNAFERFYRKVQCSKNISFLYDGQEVGGDEKVLTIARKDVGRDRVVFLGDPYYYLLLKVHVDSYPVNV